MALPDLTKVALQGQTTMRPNFMERVTFAGDDAYPADGTPDFQAYLETQLGRKPTVLQVHGYGFTGANITHLVNYDVANDKLLVYVLAGTPAPASDLSAITFDVIIAYR